MASSNTSIILAICSATILALCFYPLLENRNKTYEIPKEVKVAFDEWKVKYGRLFSSPEEQDYRLKVFYKNWVEVKSSSDENVKYELNHFADLSEEEFKSKYLMHESVMQEAKKYHEEALESQANNGINIEELSSGLQGSVEIDWVKENKVLTPRNQKLCGSCWAFTAAAAIESAYLIKGSSDMEYISVQQMVDCFQNENGCQGGLPPRVFYALSETGYELSKDVDYPYENDQNECRDAPRFYSISSYYMLQDSDRAHLQALKVGPVAIGLDGLKFRFYKSGVSNPRCGPPNHAVTIVGHGYDQYGDLFWKIKNSWGSSWGEEGYFRIKKGGGCKISLAAIPIV